MWGEATGIEIAGGLQGSPGNLENHTAIGAVIGA